MSLAGSRVKVWVEHEEDGGEPSRVGGFVGGTFTGEVIDKVVTPYRVMPGVHIHLDQGGYLRIMSFESVPSRHIEWSHRLLGAIAKVADVDDDAAVE